MWCEISIFSPDQQRHLAWDLNIFPWPAETPGVRSQYFSLTSRDTCREISILSSDQQRHLGVRSKYFPLTNRDIRAWDLSIFRWPAETPGVRSQYFPLTSKDTWREITIFFFSPDQQRHLGVRSRRDTWREISILSSDKQRHLAWDLNIFPWPADTPGVRSQYFPLTSRDTWREIRGWQHWQRPRALCAHPGCDVDVLLIPYKSSVSILQAV